MKHWPFAIPLIFVIYVIPSTFTIEDLYSTMRRQLSAINNFFIIVILKIYIFMSIFEERQAICLQKYLNNFNVKKINLILIMIS